MVLRQLILPMERTCHRPPLQIRMLKLEIFTRRGALTRKLLFDSWPFCSQKTTMKTAIREFMSSSTKRDLIIICNHEGNVYFEELRPQKLSLIRIHVLSLLELFMIKTY